MIHLHTDETKEKGKAKERQEEIEKKKERKTVDKNNQPTSKQR